MAGESIHEVEHRILGAFPAVKSFIVVGQDLVLVDTGINAGSAKTIEKELTSFDRKLSDVDFCVITHAHRDHVGGLKALKEGGKLFLVAAHEDEADAIERATGVRVDMRLVDGQEVGGLRVAYAPGHTLGSIALLTGDALIAGDAVTGHDGSLGPPNRMFSKDKDLAYASVASLALMDYDRVYVSHGKSLASGGKEAMTRLVAMLGLS